MDTVILALNDGSCHDNKSQRADPFVVITHIIAGKTKPVKDRFYRLILDEVRTGAPYRPFRAFWENWGNARRSRNESKRVGSREGKDALREFCPGTPL
ncbi:hypothetical protein [Klebsiella sp. DNRA6]|uniref:hypothetical protein n=1 Tax=Klebsiella sp. DNRA6 TaxID=2723057 RepID=UPI001B7D1373|nr:hypothetical protein [Klebsiella sp. DNRA6]